LTKYTVLISRLKKEQEQTKAELEIIS